MHVRPLPRLAPVWMTIGKVLMPGEWSILLPEVPGKALCAIIRGTNSKDAIHIKQSFTYLSSNCLKNKLFLRRGVLMNLSACLYFVTETFF